MCKIAKKCLYLHVENIKGSLMANKVLAFLVCMVLATAVPVVSQAETLIEIIDNDTQNIAISVNENTLHISNASGQVVYIYNVAGVKVMSVKVEGMDKKIELNLSKGCYIVKVGKVVRKISIK